MARADKQAAIEEIVDSFNDSAGAVLTEYRGLSVKQLQELRRSLGDHAQYSVVKNTLAKIAADQVGIESFAALLNGPTAIAFLKNDGDVVEAAKGLRDFAKTYPALVIKGGVLDGKPLDPREIAKLADLESREVLMAKLAGAMLASLSQAVYLLNAPLAQAARLAGALQAKAEEDPSILRGGAGTPTEAAASDDSPAEAPTESPTEASTEPSTEASAEETPTGDSEPAADPVAEAPAEAPAEPVEEPAATNEPAGEATEEPEASETSEAGAESADPESNEA